jgi:hypothetical protein
VRTSKLTRAEVEGHARAWVIAKGGTEADVQAELEARLAMLGDHLAEEDRPKETTMSEQVESKSSKTKAKKPAGPRQWTEQLDVKMTEKEPIDLRAVRLEDDALLDFDVRLLLAARREHSQLTHALFDTNEEIRSRALSLDERQPVLFDAPLTATVGEVTRAKNGRQAKVVPGETTEDRCTKESATGDRCTRLAAHRGAHGYRDPSPKA